MQPDNISLNKAAIIERCIRRIHQEHDADPGLNNITHLDAMTLNIERACQAAIDLAMHIVAAGHHGMPQSSADAFMLLAVAGKLDKALAERLAAMTGFRNVAIHQYQDMDKDIINQIARERWRDLVAFCAAQGLRINVDG